MFPESSAVEVDAVMLALERIVREGAATGAAAGYLGPLRSLVESMARDGVQREDPMRELFARIGDKWSTLLLLLLRTGSYRHAVLRRLVSTVGSEGRISQRMLTLRLRALERDGLIVRSAISTHPPGVEYALTALGTSLLQQLDTLMQWVRAHQRQIREARAQFEANAAARDTKPGE